MDISQFDLQSEIEDIHWWFKARRELIFSALKKYIPPNKDKVIVEIGCGTGGNLKFLNRHYKVIGVDISPKAVEYAAKKINCEILFGDFRKVLMDRWNDIDAILLLDVLEHIGDDMSFLKDVINHSKSDTILLITVPAHMFLWSHHDTILGHKRRYSSDRLRSLWKEAEIEEVYFTPFNTILFPAIALYRILQRERSYKGGSDLKLPSKWINYLLYRIFSIERMLIKMCHLPFGISYLAVLKKNKK